MGNRLQKTIKRIVKHAVLSIRTFRASWLRAGSRKRMLFVGSAAGVAVAMVALIVMLASMGKAEAGAPSATNAQGGALLDHTQSLSADGLVDITPSPTPPPTPVPTPVPTPTPTPDPTLKRGMEKPEVENLQKRLMELGYLDLDEPTQKFGPATEAAVERFQRQVNFTESLGIQLDIDGIAGLRTLELIYSASAPKYCVVFGMEGDDITEIQTQLKDLGYMSVVTGYYGDTTVTSLKSFQSENDLSADGLCGENTLSLLYSDEAKESPTKRKEARTRANIDDMISTAKDQLGDPYILGRRGPDSFDCSGLVYYCLKQAGSNRQRLTAAGYAQVSGWEKITSIYDLKKGDLIFFYSDDFSKIGHVGIVINSSGEMIDASSSNGEVVRRDYITNYWKKHFYCGRRPW